MIIGTLLGLIIGWARGGSFKRLASIEFKLWWLIPIAFVLQASLPFLFRFSAGRALGVQIYLLSFLLILLALSANRRLAYALPIAIGLFSNLLVVALNGAMPVYDSTGKFIEPGAPARAFVGVHVAATSQTRLGILGDWLAVPPPYPQPAIMSPGDLLMGIGLLLFIQHAMRQGGTGRDGAVRGGTGGTRKRQGPPSRTTRRSRAASRTGSA